MSLLQDIPILSIILLSPLLGLAAVLLLPSSRSNWLKTAAIIGSLPPLALALWLYADFNKGRGGDYAELLTWLRIPLNAETLQGVTEYVLALQYSLGIDGLSLPLLLLTTVVTAMAAMAAVHVKKRWKAFYFWFFLLEIGMLGVFLARDVFLFFIFFELTLVAMFFLIGIWGLYDRERAANRFLLYNGIGSALMLVAFIILVNTAGFQIAENGASAQFIYSGSYEVIALNLADPTAWANIAPQPGGGVNPIYLSDGLKGTLFVLLLLAFGIKLPVFPFHTWMLKVHKEAPPAVVMIHSGILLKMGAYGLLRFGVSFFPEQAKDWAVVLAVLGVVNLLYGALLAFRQQEFRLVLAYSSISHMGIVLIGIAALNSTGLHGAVFQLVSHGLISALLFLIVGSLYERTRTTELSELGGLARSVPFISGILLTAGLALLGLPGLSGFVGEFLALLGLFETMRWLTALAVVGVILTAVYVLRSVLKITFGSPREELTVLKDARFIEALPMIVLLAFIVLIGCYPAVLTDTVQGGVEAIVEQLNQARSGG